MTDENVGRIVSWYANPKPDDAEHNKRIDAAVESALHKTGVAPYPKTRFEIKRWRRFVRHLLSRLSP